MPRWILWAFALTACGSPSKKASESGQQALITSLPALEGTYSHENLSHPVPQYREIISFSTVRIFYKEGILDHTDFNIHLVEKENLQVVGDYSDTIAKYEGEDGIRQGHLFSFEGRNLMFHADIYSLQGEGGTVKIVFEPRADDTLLGKKTVFSLGTTDVLFEEQDVYKKN